MNDDILIVSYYFLLFPVYAVEAVEDEDNNVTMVPDITEQALAVKDFHYLSRMKPFLRFYLHRQKNANGSKFGLFL